MVAALRHAGRFIEWLWFRLCLLGVLPLAGAMFAWWAARGYPWASKWRGWVRYPHDILDFDAWSAWDKAGCAVGAAASLFFLHVAWSLHRKPGAPPPAG